MIMSRLLRLLAGAVALMPGIGNADDNLFLTGAEVTDASASYLYLGTSLPLPDSSLAKGYVFHLWADYLTRHCRYLIARWRKVMCSISGLIT